MDLLFLKRLDTTHWLALRMPPDLNIAAGTDNAGQVASGQWTLDAVPKFDWAGARYFGPAALEKGEKISLTWMERPKERFAGRAFDGVLADVSDMAESETTNNIKQQLEDAQTKAGVSLPLRAYRAYVETQGGSNRSIEDWIANSIAILSDRPGKLPIEAFGGLLFLVEADGPPVPQGDGIFVDDEEPTKAAPAELLVKAFQHSKGVSFECADAVGSAAYTNSSVHDAISGGTKYSGYYRITRTLGVVERPSRRSGLVAIPYEVDDEPSWNLGTDVPAKERWPQRRFLLADSLAPDELIGELLNYRIELLNPHGRVVRAGRVMLQRHRLDPPAAIARATARLVAGPGAGDATMAIRFDLPPTEKSTGVGLELVVYRLESPALPTGFYGDADDTSVQVARLLSDIDPAAFMDVRASDQLPTGASSESAQANLSNHGLTPFVRIHLEELGPREQSKHGPTDDSPWSQCRWEVGVKGLDELLPRRRAVRIMLALRRLVAADSAGAVFDGPVLESPVLEPQMLIGFDANNAERDQIVPHFEQFWEEPVALGLLDVDQVFFSEVDPPGEGSPPKEAENLARVRMQVQHLIHNATDEAELVGGYRIWMRDLPARHAQGFPFEALAVVQAVPQLVKAYAPIEVGRQWWVQGVSQIDGEDKGVPDTFLASPSPQAMIRSGKEVGMAEKVAEALNGLLKDIQDDKASKRDVRGGALLLQFWRSLDPSDCKEVILTIAQRRELTRVGAEKWLADPSYPSGNWIFFCDQNGAYLGRAWTFKGKTAGLVKRGYILNEVPNTEDTVAVDDFGQMTWNWTGLQDAWHHELEWVIEPLSRYAPLRRRLLTQPASEPGDRPKVEPRHPAPTWQEGLAKDGVPEANVHRLAILRRMPLTGRVGLIPVPDAEEDAFVWKVIPPPEFRRATHNTHARTALGALRLEVIEASAKTMLAEYFKPAEKVDPLIKDWCRHPPLDTSDPPATLESLEEGHQLVIDQPACFQVMLTVRPRADTKAGEETHLGQLAERVPKTFKNDIQISFDHCFPRGLGSELVVPLARLGWSYRGSARPTVAEVIGRATPDNVSIGSMPGLRLPDPDALMTVFVMSDDDVLSPCAYFFGPAVARDYMSALDHWPKVDSDTVRWGVAYCDNKVVTNITLTNGGGNAGDLLLLLEGLDASRLRVLWKRGRESSKLLTPRLPGE